MQRRAIVCVFVAAVLCVSGRIRTTAEVPPPAVPQPTAGARIAGRLIAADNAAPVRRASVTLTGQPANSAGREPFVRRVETDATGRFEFANLPVGSYWVRVDSSLTGYVVPPRPRPVSLSGSNTADLTIRVERTGAIEGRVLDEFGEGVMDITLHAVRRGRIDGRLAGVGRSIVTNDLGEFRLYNLPAGEYLVMAVPPSSDPVTSDAAVPPLDFSPRDGYVNTFYLGAPAITGAQQVTVRAGTTSEDVELRLQRDRLATVSVRPVTSAGVPLGRNATVTLTRLGESWSAWATRQARARDEGVWVFRDVAPGRYYVVVGSSFALEEAAYVNVTVARENISLNVRTNAGATVTGRVLLDGQPPPEQSMPITVTARRPPDSTGPNYVNAPLVKVSGTDRFELRGLRGPMTLFSEVGSGALVSIKRSGEEVGSRTLDFTGTETVDDVVIELTTKVAQLNVSVSPVSGVGDPEAALIVLFPEDSSLPRYRSRYAQTTVARGPAAGGANTESPPAAQLIRVVPGRYLVAAIYDPGLYDPVAPPVLAKIRALATPVTLSAGQTGSVTLEVIDADR